MKTLTMALYAEGTTDDRFLPSIIQRTAKNILLDNDASDVDVWEPIPINRNRISGESLQERIYNASKHANGVHILFIHQDADNRTITTCYKDRIAPGINLIKSEQDGVCKTVVPVIPVRNIEAWLLCDPSALIRVIGSPLNAAELGLPVNPQDIERIFDPKMFYQEVVTKALSRRRRGNINTGIYYERLGREIDLSRLDRVPAYKVFKNKLIEALIELNFHR